MKPIRILHAYDMKGDMDVFKASMVLATIGTVGCMTAKGIVGKLISSLFTISCAVAGSCAAYDYAMAEIDDKLDLVEELSE